MVQYISKNALVAEIEKSLHKEPFLIKNVHDAYTFGLESALKIINTLEVKEVDEQKERMNECPYRQVGCRMYEGKVLECKGACSWVVDYPKLKELKTQKGE